jgi:N-acetylmuramoyl-L-alanine amidase
MREWFIMTKKTFVGYTRRGIVTYLNSFREGDTPIVGWSEIVVHHTFAPTVKNFMEKPDANFWLTAIDNFHRARGWNGIGYHFVITPDGLIYIGRKLNQVGAHTVGHNATGIGVCLLGNFDEEEPTAEQWISLKYLLAWLCYVFNIPVERIYFHRQFAPKTCPGKKMDLDKVRKAVRETKPLAVTIWHQIIKPS